LSEEYKLDKKQTDELFVMSKKIRDTYIDYSHLPGEYRIAYALVCDPVLAWKMAVINVCVSYFL
jgi:hypothetical protein